MLTGLQAQLTFFKGLLDKLGIEAESSRSATTKAAAEPLTRTEMSPEFRSSSKR